MKTIKGKYLASIVVLLSPVMAHADIIYTINTEFTNGSATGFIQTDGTLGVLTTANILDWTLTLTAVGLTNSPSTFSRAGNRTSVQGDNLSATATELLFDFTDSENRLEFFILQNRFGNTNYYCLINRRGCGRGGSGIYMGRIAGSGTESIQSSSPSGAFASATAVPEPGTLTLFGLGLLGIGLARRKVA